MPKGICQLSKQEIGSPNYTCYKWTKWILSMNHSQSCPVQNPERHPYIWAFYIYYLLIAWHAFTTGLSHLKEILYIKTIKYEFERMRAMENKIKIRARLGIDEQR